MGKAKIVPWGPRAGRVRIERFGGENTGDQVREVGRSSGGSIDTIIAFEYLGTWQ